MSQLPSLVSALRGQWGGGQGLQRTNPQKSLHTLYLGCHAKKSSATKEKVHAISLQLQIMPFLVFNGMFLILESILPSENRKGDEKAEKLLHRL